MTKHHQPENQNLVFEYLENLYGQEWVIKFKRFLDSDDFPLYVRVNRLKTDHVSLQQRLREKYGIETSQHPDIADALRIDTGQEKVSKTLEHILGYYYIQSLSSMLPPLVLDAQPGETILDLCAAPGSKSTQIAEKMQNSGVLVANEIQGDRIGSLMYNFERLGILNFGVIHQSGEWLPPYFGEYFDKVLADVPCSGLGILQKKGEVVNWWQLSRAERLAKVQYDLLVSAVKMAKPGGTIVYSTCTMTLEENEQVVNRVMSKFPVEIESISLPLTSQPAFGESTHPDLHPEMSRAHRIVPFESGSEGFFVVKLRKTDSITMKSNPVRKYQPVKTASWREVQNVISGTLMHFGIPTELFREYRYLAGDKYIQVLDPGWGDEIGGFFHRTGLRLGKYEKHGFLLSSHGIRTFGMYAQQNCIDLKERADVKSYLDGGTLKHLQGSNGYVIVTYDGLYLGTGIVSSQGLKSRFPRADRTQKIEHY